MKRAAHQFMFLNLAAILLAVFFVLQPSHDTEVAKFQDNVKHQFVAAAKELWGPASPGESLALVWNGLSAFYDASTTQTLALLTPSNRVVEFALSWDANYQVSKQIALAPIVTRRPSEEPLYNIVPMSPDEALIDPYFNDDLAYTQNGAGQVAGESIGVDDFDVHHETDAPKTEHKAEWVTLKDSITGVPYCIAVFNGELNSYAGTCAQDTETLFYEN